MGCRRSACGSTPPTPTHPYLPPFLLLVLCVVRFSRSSQFCVSHSVARARVCVYVWCSRLRASVSARLCRMRTHAILLTHPTALFPCPHAHTSRASLRRRRAQHKTHPAVNKRLKQHAPIMRVPTTCAHRQADEVHVRSHTDGNCSWQSVGVLLRV